MAGINQFDDRDLINRDTYHYYANTNEEHLSLPVKGIILEFPGLGGGSCLGGSIDMGSYSTPRTIAFGEKGILVAYLFPGPWSWGNRGAVRMADAVVRALADKYALPEDLPLAVSGGSMGGLGALIYAANTRYKLTAVAAACPCVDVKASLSCAEHFPRTYVSAVASYDKSLSEALDEISPICRIADMPKASYFICSDAEDELFPESDCDLYVEKLRAAGHAVEYHKQPGKKHGGFLPEVRDALHEALEKAILS